MKIDLQNLTKNRREEQKKDFAMRVNVTAQLAYFPPMTKEQKRYRTLYGPYTPRERAPDETPSRTHVHGQGPYDGAELRPFSDRPGALDFKALPSRGFGR